jgi:hypothetical protein
MNMIEFYNVVKENDAAFEVLVSDTGQGTPYHWLYGEIMHLF